MINTKEIPFIEQEFDIVCFDLHMVDADGLYNLVIKHLKYDKNGMKVTDGICMKTAVLVEGIDEAHPIIQAVIDTGIFYHDVSALGSIYDTNNVKIDSVNWNELKSNVDEFDMFNIIPGNLTIH